MSRAISSTVRGFMYVRQGKRDGGQQGGGRERKTACVNVRSKGVIDRRINVYPMGFQTVHTMTSLIKHPKVTFFFWH